MKIPQKYIVITSLALSLSGSVLGLSYLMYYLAKEKILSKEIGFLILIVYIFYVLYMMVRYAVSKKN